MYVYMFYTGRSLTAKFYSKYEGHIGGEYPDIVEKIKAVKDRGPKEKLIWPETSNQWFILTI